MSENNQNDEELYVVAEGKLGSENLQSIKDSTRQIELALLKLAINQSGNMKDTDLLTQTIRDFSNGLYATVGSEDFEPGNAAAALKKAVTKALE